MQRAILVVIVTLAALLGFQRLRREPSAGRPAAAPPTPSSATASDGAEGAEAAGVERLTPHQLTALVRRYRSPTVLVLYGTECGLCRELMPGLEQIATRHRDDGVLVHAVNTDPDSASYDIPRFLRSTGASFPALRLTDSAPLELGQALASAGSEVVSGDSAYTLPVVVVWDRAGAVVAQAQGMASADELERVVSGVLAQGR